MRVHHINAHYLSVIVQNRNFAMTKLNASRNFLFGKHFTPLNYLPSLPVETLLTRKTVQLARVRIPKNPRPRSGTLVLAGIRPEYSRAPANRIIMNLVTCRDDTVLLTRIISQRNYLVQVTTTTPHPYRARPNNDTESEFVQFFVIINWLNVPLLLKSLVKKEVRANNWDFCFGIPMIIGYLRGVFQFHNSKTLLAQPLLRVRKPSDRHDHQVSEKGSDTYINLINQFH